MPVVRISDATFTDLKLISSWFQTKTPAETLDEVVREMMDHLGLERDAEQGQIAQLPDGVMQFDRAPGLSFTRVLSVQIDGKEITKPNWANALIAMIEAVRGKGLQGKKLVQELQVPAKIENSGDFGYSFHSSLGISVQGQSATDAWKEISRLALKWKIPAKVTFQWRDNPKAQFPGKIGELKV